MRHCAALLGMLFLLAGCTAQPRPEAITLSTKSPIELRAIQARAFDTTDRNRTLRTVIAALQDLGYMIDKVEPTTGTITANKRGGVLRLSAVVTPRNATQVMIRANAQIFAAKHGTQVDDPEFYQKLFFEPVSKALFLNALQVNDP